MTKPPAPPKRPRVVGPTLLLSTLNFTLGGSSAKGDNSPSVSVDGGGDCGPCGSGVQGLLGSVSPSQSASPEKGSLHTMLLVFSLGYSVEMELLIKVRAQGAGHLERMREVRDSRRLVGMAQSQGTVSDSRRKLGSAEQSKYLTSGPKIQQRQSV